MHRISQNPGHVGGSFYFKRVLKLLGSMYLDLISSMDEETADNKRMEGNSSECSHETFTGESSVS